MVVKNSKTHFFGLGKWSSFYDYLSIFWIDEFNIQSWDNSRYEAQVGVSGGGVIQMYDSIGGMMGHSEVQNNKTNGSSNKNEFMSVQLCEWST